MDSVSQQRPISAESSTRVTRFFALLRESDLYHPLIAFLVSRFVIFFGGYIGELAIPGVDGEGLYHVAPNNLFVDIWSRWDSAFYISIVEQGYSF